MFKNVVRSIVVSVMITISDWMLRKPGQGRQEKIDVYPATTSETVLLLSNVISMSVRWLV